MSAIKDAIELALKEVEDELESYGDTMGDLSKAYYTETLYASGAYLRGAMNLIDSYEFRKGLRNNK